jgi:lipopolysaccharide export LptBFGC system permease protein LptF
MILLAMGSNYNAAAILTWVFPVLLFTITVIWLYFQRGRR